MCRNLYWLLATMALIGCGGSSEEPPLSDAAGEIGGDALDTGTDSAADSAKNDAQEPRPDTPADSDTKAETTVDASIDANKDVGANCECPVPLLTWTTEGGLVAYRDDVVIANCDSYNLRRQPQNPPGGAKECKATLAPCMANSVTSRDALIFALNNADVKKAISNGSAMYGADPRPIDGTIDDIKIGNVNLQIGTQCTTSATCTAIPQGLIDLRSVLTTYYNVISNGTCASALK